MHKDKEDSHGGMLGHVVHNLQEPPSFRTRDITTYEHAPLDGDTFLQALNGFLMILTCEGEVFFATHSIESYLGFHQSDIVHQSVYELVHSEDREELQRQLLWNSFLSPQQHQHQQQSAAGSGHSPTTSDQPGSNQPGATGLMLAEALQPHNCHLLERSFTVRFRCLLDNTSGFLRLDIRGRVKVLHGQNRKTEEPPLALFAICTPFGPPSLLEIPQKEVMFKSKHKLDLGLVSMDQRGKMLLGYSDGELANMGGYDLVHFDDLAYVASAHQELLKTGASGMIAYRFQTKEGQWQWLQTSSRLVYKNSKPDFVISTHRPLMEEEGRDLLGKRTMDFKVSYLDAGLTNSYFTDSDQMTSVLPTTPSPVAMPPTNQRVNRRYKTQLRDFLSTCRTKRKLSHSAHPALQTTGVNNNINNNNNNTINNINNNSSHLTGTLTMDYIPADNHLVTPLAYHTNLNNIYPSAYATTVAPQNENALYMGHATSNFQTMYPDNLFHQYRPLSGYYPEYPPGTGYVTNGFLDMSPRATNLPTYDTSYQIAKDDKLYACAQVLESPKYAYTEAPRSYVSYPISSPLPTHHSETNRSSSKQSPLLSSPEANQSPSSKMEDVKSEILVQPPPTAEQGSGLYNSEQQRQTVLMWGSTINNHTNHHQNNSESRSPNSNSSTPSLNGAGGYHEGNKLLKQQDAGTGMSLHHQHHQHQQHQQQPQHQQHHSQQQHHAQQQQQQNTMKTHNLSPEMKHLDGKSVAIFQDTSVGGGDACKWSNGVVYHHQDGGSAMVHGAEVWQPYHHHHNHHHQFYQYNATAPAPPHSAQYAQSSSVVSPSNCHTQSPPQRPSCVTATTSSPQQHTTYHNNTTQHSTTTGPTSANLRTGVLCCASRR